MPGSCPSCAQTQQAPCPDSDRGTHTSAASGVPRSGDPSTDSNTNPQPAVTALGTTGANTSANRLQMTKTPTPHAIAWVILPTTLDPVPTLPRTSGCGQQATLATSPSICREHRHTRLPLWTTWHTPRSSHNQWTTASSTDPCRPALNPASTPSSTSPPEESGLNDRIESTPSLAQFLELQEPAVSIVMLSKYGVRHLSLSPG